MSTTAAGSMSRGMALSGARLLCGLVRVKVVALALGVAGIGIFSLIQQISLAGTALVSLSLAVPIINIGRAHVIASDLRSAGAVAGTALSIVVLNSVLLALIAGLFGDALLGELGLGAIDPLLVWPLVLAILMSALATSLWEGLSYLVDRFDIYVVVGIAGAVADMIFIALGASFEGLHGAVLALPAGPLVMVITYAALLGRDRTARVILSSLSVRLRHVARLLQFSATMFVAVFVTSAGLTIARSWILTISGSAANGALQTATALSAYSLAFATTGFWGHIHARAAGHGDTAQVREELDAALRLAALISFTACGVVSALSSLLVPVFYSHQFVAGIPLIRAYMPGELCFQLLTLLTSYQLTISLRRRYVLWSCGYIGLLLAVGFLAIPAWGPPGYVGSHNLASLVMLAVATIVCWNSGQIRGSFVGLAALLVIIMASTSALLLLFDSGPIATILALVPPTITGAWVLRQLFGETRLQARAS